MMTPDELSPGVRKAAEVIAAADALLIGAGAGGLSQRPDWFRGAAPARAARSSNDSDSPTRDLDMPRL